MGDKNQNPNQGGDGGQDKTTVVTQNVDQSIKQFIGKLTNLKNINFDSLSDPAKMQLHNLAVQEKNKIEDATDLSNLSQQKMLEGLKNRLPDDRREQLLLQSINNLDENQKKFLNQQQLKNYNYLKGKDELGEVTSLADLETKARQVKQAQQKAARQAQQTRKRTQQAQIQKRAKQIQDIKQIQNLRKQKADLQTQRNRLLGRINAMTLNGKEPQARIVKLSGGKESPQARIDELKGGEDTPQARIVKLQEQKATLTNQKNTANTQKTELQGQNKELKQELSFAPEFKKKCTEELLLKPNCKDIYWFLVFCGIFTILNIILTFLSAGDSSTMDDKDKKRKKQMIIGVYILSIVTIIFMSLVIIFLICVTNKSTNNMIGFYFCLCLSFALIILGNVALGSQYNELNGEPTTWRSQAIYAVIFFSIALCLQGVCIYLIKQHCNTIAKSETLQ